MFARLGSPRMFSRLIRHSRVQCQSHASCQSCVSFQSRVRGQSRIAIYPNTATNCATAVPVVSKHNERYAHSNARAQNAESVLRAVDARMIIHDQYGQHSYADITKCASAVAKCIVDILDVETLKGDCVALLCSHDISYVVALWAVWMAGGAAVPLYGAYPAEDLNYFIQDSGSRLLLYTEEYDSFVRERHQKDIPALKLKEKDFSTLGNKLEGWVVADEQRSVDGMRGRHAESAEQPALVIYTSGTTGRPKGVVHTHASLQAQMQGMIDAWGWTGSDVILHVLPLHHVHGIVNVLLTPMLVGATCVLANPNDKSPSNIWKTLLCRPPENPLEPVITEKNRITVFMAVPTIYARLIKYYKDHVARHGAFYGMTADAVREHCCENIRLMVSGSAALPEPVMADWEAITGHTLLERYGMTELGMALTNPLHGTRTPGAVGRPFPQVQARIVTSRGDGSRDYDVIAEGDCRDVTVTAGCEGKEGDLQIKGATLFKEYLNKPEATRESFTEDGWFQTGDTATYKDGVFRILGRTSVDIVKSGGYKISALEIERHLLAHDAFEDVAVLGVPDVTYGELVVAVVVLKRGSSLQIGDLEKWCKTRLVSYQVPRVWEFVDKVPRNAMGKVNKKELLKTLFLEP